jgi:hypothetical protein
MTVIDPPDIALAREFRERPYGVHSPALQALLNEMRRGPHKGRYALYSSKPGEEWMLIQLSGERGKPPTFHPDVVFTTYEAAEWHVFKLRWQQMTGRPLEID